MVFRSNHSRNSLYWMNLTAPWTGWKGLSVSLFKTFYWFRYDVPVCFSMKPMIQAHAMCDQFLSVFVGRCYGAEKSIIGQTPSLNRDENVPDFVQIWHLASGIVSDFRFEIPDLKSGPQIWRFQIWDPDLKSEISRPPHKPHARKLAIIVVLWFLLVVGS